MTDESIKLVLADDQALVRGALVALLSLEPDIEVVGQCSRGDEVVLTVEKTRPDVLLLDIEMPGMDGIEVADRLAGADVKILIVTTFGRPGYLCRGGGIRRQGHPGLRTGPGSAQGSSGRPRHRPILGRGVPAGGVQPVDGEGARCVAGGGVGGADRRHREEALPVDRNGP